MWSFRSSSCFSHQSRLLVWGSFQTVLPTVEADGPGSLNRVMVTVFMKQYQLFGELKACILHPAPRPSCHQKNRVKVKLQSFKNRYTYLPVAYRSSYLLPYTYSESSVTWGRVASNSHHSAPQNLGQLWGVLIHLGRDEGRMTFAHTGSAGRRSLGERCSCRGLRGRAQAGWFDSGRGEEGERGY